MTPKTQKVRAIAESFLVWFFVVFLAFFALAKLKAPEPAGADAPLTEFSAERALTHIRTIAIGPHPVGSVANDE